MNKKESLWDVSIGKTSYNSSLESQVKEIIRLGTLAPSIHNTQPWSFNIGKNTIMVNVAFDSRPRIADPSGRHTMISVGCLLENMRVAANFFGIRIDLNFDKLDSNVVIIEFSKDKINKSHDRLVFNISKRVSNKSIYKNKALSKEKVKAIIPDVYEYKNANAKILTDNNSRKKASNIHMFSSNEVAVNSEFASEINRWIKFNTDRSVSGMPGYVFGLNNLKVALAKLLLKINPNVMRKIVASDGKKVSKSGGVGVIYSEGDSKIDWLYSGMLYERLSLRAVDFGLSTTPLAASIESKSGLESMTKLFKVKNSRIQIFFRVGEPLTDQAHTPRHNLKDKILYD